MPTTHGVGMLADDSLAKHPEEGKTDTLKETTGKY